MTCIPSNFDVGTHGDSEGPIIRYGARMILTRQHHRRRPRDCAARHAPSNECFELDRDLNNDTSNAAAARREHAEPHRHRVPRGLRVRHRGQPRRTATPGLQWIANTGTAATYAFNTFNVVITDPANANVQVLQPGTFFSVDLRRRSRPRSRSVDAAAANVVIGSAGDARDRRLHRRRAQHGELDGELDLRHRTPATAASTPWWE